MRVAVLALQGAFAEHVAAFESLGHEAFEARLARDLIDIDALVIPGGESTTVSKLLDSSALRGDVASLIASGIPVLGTCAGMIMLAAGVVGSAAHQSSFGAIDIDVERNAFGRQVQSFEAEVEIPGLDGGPFNAVFIRAPSIVRAGPTVELIAEFDGRGIAARDGNVLVTAFHPELTDDLRLHRFFADMASEG